MSKINPTPGQICRAALQRARSPVVLSSVSRPAAGGMRLTVEAELPPLSAGNLPGTVVLVDECGRKLGIFGRPDLAVQTRDFLQ